MAIQTINIGSSANKGDGDPLRTAFKKINENFAELDTTNTIRDIKGSVFGDDSTLLVDGVNSLIPSSVLSGNLPAIDGSALTGITVSSVAFSNVTSKPTTIAGYGITDAFDGAFGSLSATPTTLAGYGITDGAGLADIISDTTPQLGGNLDVLSRQITTSVGVDGNTNLQIVGRNVDIHNDNEPNLRLIGPASASADNLANVRFLKDDLQNPGTDIEYAVIAGLGKTGSGTDRGKGELNFNLIDAQAGTNIDALFLRHAGATFGTDILLGTNNISGVGTLNSHTIPGGTGTLALTSDVLVLGTTASTALAGNTALFDGDYGSLSNTPTLFDGVFASLTSKPTTIAGYGITDALALGTSSTTALAGDTSIPDGTFASLTSKPSTISGYGITDAYTKTEVDNLTTTLDGDLTGSVFGDDSTLLVDGNNNKIVGPVETYNLRTTNPTIALGYLAGQTDQTPTSVAIGSQAGNNAQNVGAVGIGYKAGNASQGLGAVALGYQSGQNTQGGNAIAIGEMAGQATQGGLGIAIGYTSGQTTQGTKAIAIGYQSGFTTQGTSAIAIGDTAGNVEQSIECIAIGKNAGAGASVTATYVSGGVSGDPITMVVDDTTGIIPGMRITGTGFTYTLLEQQQKVLSVDNATTITIDAIANNGTPSGTLTFKSAQEFYSIAIGSSAGLTSQNAGAVALGYQAGMTAQMGAVAVGSRAGEVTQGNGGVAVGVDSGRTNQGLHGIAIGKFAGNSNQSQKGIAIGYQTGETSQGEYAIAIGERAGETNQHANTIILNASTSPLNSVQTDQFIVKPVRSSAGTTHLQYNSSTGEITHLDTITATIVATTATPPTANSDPGDTGEIRYDDNYLYIKTASGWKRTALSGIV